MKLEQFTEDDIDLLISWIPDRRFLIQFAGPRYSFPLSREQLQADIADMKKCLFKAIDGEGNIVGHIQLLKIDRNNGSAYVGGVLIGEKNKRGSGLGFLMVNALINKAFYELQLKTLLLNVFDFNIPAYRCYEKAGFKEVARKEVKLPGFNERWYRIKMKLEAAEYDYSSIKETGFKAGSF
jgi:RimJ/RimL family protein N-acetyltransferase